MSAECDAEVNRQMAELRAPERKAMEEVGRAVLAAIQEQDMKHSLKQAWHLIACAIVAIAAVFLGACGGGGDDGGPPPAGQQQTVLDATTSWGQSTTSPTERLAAELVTPPFVIGAAGRVEVCADVVWTQQLRRAAGLELRSLIAGAGPELEALSATAAGVPGSNTLAFRRCQAFDHPGGQAPSSARITLDMRSSGAQIPMQGFTVSARWQATVVR